MIILIGSQKGGCGKSTLATNIAAALSQNKDIILVDSDRQSTAANWGDDRAGDEKLTKVNVAQKYDNIRDTLLDFKKRYDFVIVDAAGRDSRELRTGATAADILIIPLRPSQADLDTLPKMSEIIQGAKDINPELKIFGIITMASANTRVKESEEARVYFKEFPSITLLNTVIFDRKIYRDALSEGKGVTETTNDKAKAEIESLLKEVGL